MKSNFKKRIFTPEILIKDTTSLVINLQSILDTITSERISRVFGEKIMLAVTSVNQCRYCTWLHSDLALSAGADKDQISMILGQQFEEVSQEELPALSYAFHVAETNRNPSIKMTSELYHTYGAEKAKDIENYIQLIYFGNLSGNTFDAFLSRLKGYEVEDSNAFFEAFFALVSALPLGLIALRANKMAGALKQKLA